MNIVRELGDKLEEGVKMNEPLALHTSWEVGGPADYFLCPVSIDEVIEIVRFSRKHNLPMQVIGNGSNLLVRDGGIRGLVVKVGDAFSYIDCTYEQLVVGAGTPMTYLARVAAEEALCGCEFMVGIPGSLGGAIIMNAGSFGGYIGEKVSSVKLVSLEGEALVLDKEQLSFAYRWSNLLGRGVIVEASIQLEKGNKDESLKKMEYFLAERRRRHPSLPSAGSVFRNLPDQPAGRLIESAGAKGMRIGGAEVSSKHANFIVNRGDATASDILKLMDTVRSMVKEKYDIELQPEVKVVGEEI